MKKERREEKGGDEGTKTAATRFVGYLGTCYAGHAHRKSHSRFANNTGKGAEVDKTRDCLRAFPRKTAVFFPRVKSVGELQVETA